MIGTVQAGAYDRLADRGRGTQVLSHLASQCLYTKLRLVLSSQGYLLSTRANLCESQHAWFIGL